MKYSDMASEADQHGWRPQVLPVEVVNAEALLPRSQSGFWGMGVRTDLPTTGYGSREKTWAAK